METRKQHWENIYSTKQPHEVSWTQEVPRISLDLIHSLHLHKNAAIIDVGGGDSLLADHLLKEGFEDITVLDISETAIERAKKRLGNKAEKIKWKVNDVGDFVPEREYDLWHDRAVFHFMLSDHDVDNYLNLARKTVKGFMVMGTFSETGPNKCSALHVRQYSQEQLAAQLNIGFTKLKCLNDDHMTPFNTVQNFTFCSFERKALRPAW